MGLHQPDAATLRPNEDVANTIALAHEGQAFASAHVLKVHDSLGPVSVDRKLGSVGVSGGLNADTGVGVRGGNLDVHLLGFGGRVGADGLAVDTPMGGVKCCIM